MTKYFRDEIKEILHGMELSLGMRIDATHGTQTEAA